jgi:hypothetical protein
MPLKLSIRLILSLTLLAATWAASGCTAPMEDKLGYAGEFCEPGAGHCISSLDCIDNTCTFVQTAGSISCTQMCDRLADCGNDDPTCVSDCRVTIRDWSSEAIDLFGECTLGMTEPVLSCTLVQQSPDDAPTFCYRQLPLLPERDAICSAIVERATAYAQGDADANSTALTSVRNNCRVYARTRSEERWTQLVTPVIETEQNMLTPEEMIGLTNETFLAAFSNEADQLSVDPNATSLGPLDIEQEEDPVEQEEETMMDESGDGAP